MANWFTKLFGNSNNQEEKKEEVNMEEENKHASINEDISSLQEEPENVDEVIEESHQGEVDYNRDSVLDDTSDNLDKEEEKKFQ